MDKHDLRALRMQAQGCKACPLWRSATQTVFGEGSTHARIMLVGEQPGDAEDLQGRPFVGPAGALLDRALAASGMNRAKVYVTNAVKHFKWEPRGKRRLHKTPAQQEIEACRQWLDRELAAIRPELIVCLGATATRAVTGRTVKLTAMRGRVFVREGAPALLLTMHPSSVLRVPHEEAREQAFRALVNDLAAARSFVPE